MVKVYCSSKSPVGVVAQRCGGEYYLYRSDRVVEADSLDEVHPGCTYVGWSESPIQPTASTVVTSFELGVGGKQAYCEFRL